MFKISLGKFIELHTIGDSIKEIRLAVNVESICCFSPHPKTGSWLTLNPAGEDTSYHVVESYDEIKNGITAEAPGVEVK
jgi:hypothetical protein